VRADEACAACYYDVFLHDYKTFFIAYLQK
jgi:hypothetical protein